MADRKIDQAGTPDGVIPTLLPFPVAAATSLDAGTMIATNGSGLAVPVSASSALIVWGRAEKAVDNSSGAAADKYVNVRPGYYWLDTPSSGADQITRAHTGRYCYLSNGYTACLTNSAGTRPLGGVIVGVSADWGLPSGKVLVAVGFATPFQSNPLLATAPTAFTARGVGPSSNVSDLSAFTVASNDGLTFSAGQIVFLYAQTTAAQNGPYVVGTVAAGTAPLTRPDWWPTGGAFVSGQDIRIGGEGTLFKNSVWKATAANGVIGTDNPAFYPGRVTQQAVLVAGTVTLSNVPILSATKTAVIINRTTANTASSTVQYNPSTITPGAPGTASLVVQAQVAAGTINASDVSALNVSIVNF